MRIGRRPQGPQPESGLSESRRAPEAQKDVKKTAPFGAVRMRREDAAMMFGP